ACSIDGRSSARIAAGSPSFAVSPLRDRRPLLLGRGERAVPVRRRWRGMQRGAARGEHARRWIAGEGLEPGEGAVEVASKVRGERALVRVELRRALGVGAALADQLEHIDADRLALDRNAIDPAERELVARVALDRVADQDRRAVELVEPLEP